MCVAGGGGGGGGFAEGVFDEVWEAVALGVDEVAGYGGIGGGGGAEVGNFPLGVGGGLDGDGEGLGGGDAVLIGDAEEDAVGGLCEGVEDAGGLEEAVVYAEGGVIGAAGAGDQGVGEGAVWVGGVVGQGDDGGAGGEALCYYGAGEWEAGGADGFDVLIDDLAGEAVDGFVDPVALLAGDIEVVETGGIGGVLAGLDDEVDHDVPDAGIAYGGEGADGGLAEALDVLHGGDGAGAGGGEGVCVEAGEIGAIAGEGVEGGDPAAYDFADVLQGALAGGGGGGAAEEAIGGGEEGVGLGGGDGVGGGGIGGVFAGVGTGEDGFEDGLLAGVEVDAAGYDVGGVGGLVGAIVDGEDIEQSGIAAGGGEEVEVLPWGAGEDVAELGNGAEGAMEDVGAALALSGGRGGGGGVCGGGGEADGGDGGGGGVAGDVGGHGRADYAVGVGVVFGVAAGWGTRCIAGKSGAVVQCREGVLSEQTLTQEGTRSGVKRPTEISIFWEFVPYILASVIGHPISGVNIGALG